MATRCNIRVTDGGRKLSWLYRHWDGYPACTGADLAQTLKRLLAKSAEELKPETFVNELLGYRYADEPHRQDAAIYEITDDLHGDIQWLYTVAFTPRGLRIEVREHLLFNGGRKRVIRFFGDLCEYRRYCAGSVVNMRRQIKKLRAAQRNAA